MLGLGFDGSSAKHGLSQIEVAPEELDEVRLCGGASASLRRTQQEASRHIFGKNK